MKKVSIRFYSYRPRLNIGFTWTVDIIPNIGDTVKVPNKFISQWDKKYFPKWLKDFEMDFIVKERVFVVKPLSNSWNCDVYIELDWTDEEKIKIDKYLKKYQKERGEI